MREVDLNKKVAEWICKYGYAHKRIATPGRSGEPDITGCIFGFRIELEGKLPGQEPTKLQYEKLRRWKNSGAITGWYTSLEQAKDIVLKGLGDKAIYYEEDFEKLSEFLMEMKK